MAGKLQKYFEAKQKAEYLYKPEKDIPFFCVIHSILCCL